MQGLILISISILLLATEPVVTVFAGTILGISSGLFLKVLHAKTKREGQIAQKERQVSIQVINQGLGGIKEVLVSGNSGYFTKKFLTSIRRMTSADAFILVAEKISQPFLECIIVLGILAVAGILLFMGRSLESIAPTLALFGAALIRLKSCMIKIVSSFTNLRYNAVAINPIWEDLNTISAPVTPLSTSATTNRLQNSIKINELKYSYPGSDKPSINDINLTIPKGGSVALVGPTGSGKTTLVDLMLGLLKPDEGAILEGNVDINTNLTEWHQKIGYIPQFIFLLNDTIKNNIAFGLEDSEIDEQKLQKAIYMAQLENFVSSLPEGVETIIGERGIRLSGGQRQRIGIARALYNNPEILIMDEATSALDNTTEKLLILALEKLKEDRTIIMIAHRLSTIKNCDALYFMKDGHIIASGNYEELLSKCDEFRKMAK